MIALATSFSTGFSIHPVNVAGRTSQISMAWGEDIGDSDFLRNPDGRSSQLTRDHGKLVITLATTGNINTRDNNPSLPCSPQEMADDMHECIKLGVSVLHIHARNEELKPTMRVDKFRETVRLVKERDPGSAMPLEASQRHRCEDACARWAERVSEGC